jgi:hypothetical protein
MELNAGINLSDFQDNVYKFSREFNSEPERVTYTHRAVCDKRD